MPSIPATAEGAVDFSKPEGVERLIVRVERLRGLDVGCGVIVHQAQGDLYVLTADHLLSNVDTYAVMLNERVEGKLVERTVRTSDVVLRDTKRDLACLRLKVGEAWPTPVDLSVYPTLGDFQSFQAWGASWVRGEDLKLERLRVVEHLTARRSQRDEPVAFWRIEREINPGMSGGPLFDSRGRLLGIASGNSSGSAYYVDINEVRQFLRDAGL